MFTKQAEINYSIINCIHSISIQGRCKVLVVLDRGAYLAAKREAKKAVSKAKSDRYKAVYDMLDTREGERAVYRLVRARHRSTLDMEHTKIVKGADGAVLRRSGQILERWREYYSHLCNEEFCHPPIPTVPSVGGPVLPITAVEVSAALAKMKSNKATGN
ncbi:hypothetical protein RB195_016716 [Necator americanus]|uniref:Uncharacterized protein n=1 Tax=Necator americanus TaxID=51031 RepID=A0ABR1C4B5_NECAM